VDFVVDLDGDGNMDIAAWTLWGLRSSVTRERKAMAR